MPVAGAIEVDPEATVSATFNEAIKPATVSAATVELKDGSDERWSKPTVSYSQPTGGSR